nr:immunoglobulin heavy chain junction region [Macaca mulatta]
CARDTRVYGSSYYLDYW